MHNMFAHAELNRMPWCMDLFTHANLSANTLVVVARWWKAKWLACTPKYFCGNCDWCSTVYIAHAPVSVMAVACTPFYWEFACPCPPQSAAGRGLGPRPPTGGFERSCSRAGHPAPPASYCSPDGQSWSQDCADSVLLRMWHACCF